MRWRAPATASLLGLLPVVAARAADRRPGWPVVGGAQGGGHYTPLSQITPVNVGRLQEAWVYHTGDYSVARPGHRATTFEATPILANDMLYFCTPYTR